MTTSPDTPTLVPTPAPATTPGTGGTTSELYLRLTVGKLPLIFTSTFQSGGDTILTAAFDTPRLPPPERKPGDPEPAPNQKPPPIDVDLGDMLIALVQLAVPDSDFTLDPPWDLLNKIKLTNISLRFNLTRRRIGLSYGVDPKSNPPFVKVSALGLKLFMVELWYERGAAGRSVKFNIYGTFAGMDFTRVPLGWDVLNQPPPAVPSATPKIFDLDYLGLGQHVTFRERSQLATMGTIIESMKGTFVPVKRPSDIDSFERMGFPPVTVPPPPVRKGADLIFDAGSGWLIGFRFSLLDTVTLAVIFNDPYLYGLRITLAGETVKKLAGLEFEILYRKITDSIGLYHIELKIPDAFRQIQLGAAAITLPIIVFDIYTNGNFLIDFGFPRNFNFSRSFTIEVIILGVPVLGAGGFYFGVLSSETFSDLPQIAKGDDGEPVGRFAPVIVLGVGLRIGVGKSIEKGVLSAGFFVGFQALLEGVLGVFVPADSNQSKDYFFRVRGVVAIVGHLYGTVDFGIISATVEVYVYASASITFEIYKPVVIELAAGVRLVVKLKIAFIKITLKFEATIQARFEFGSDTSAQAPWSQGSLGASALLDAPMLLGAATTAQAPSAVLPWTATSELPAAGGTPVELPLYAALDVSAGFAGDRPGATDPGRREAMLAVSLFIRRRAEDATPDQPAQPFEQFARAALDWALRAEHQSSTGTANTTPDQVSLGALRRIYTDLKAADAGPDHTAVVAFLQSTRNFTVTLQALSGDHAGESFTIFPMLPALRVEAPDHSADFGDVARFSEADRANLRQYFHDLATRNAEEVLGASAADGVPLAALLLADYVQLVLRELVQRGIEHLEQQTGPVAYATFMNAILTAADLSSPAGTAARFLFNGMRLFDPVSYGGSVGVQTPLFPLYTIAQQQWLAPDDADEKKLREALTTYTVRLGPGASSFVLRHDDPETKETNEEVRWPGPAISLKLDPTDQIPMVLAYRGAAAPFADDRRRLGAYPPVAVVPRRFALGAPTRHDPHSTGMRRLYPFPTSLREQLAASSGGTRMLARASAETGQAGSGGAQGADPAHTETLQGRWATRIDLRVRRAARPLIAGLMIPNSYEIFSGTQQAREDLFAVVDHFRQEGDPSALELALLYRPEAPAPGSSETSPLRSDQILAAGTQRTKEQKDIPLADEVTLIKANLTTLTRSSGDVLGAALEDDTPPADIASASLAAPLDFLTLLWECSIVNSGGYFLFYPGGKDKQGLPSDLFDDGELGTLTVLVTYAANDQEARAYPYHNCVSVAEGDIAGKDVVFVEAAPVELASQETLAALASRLKLTPAQVVAAAATLPGLLAPGTTVTAAGRTYTALPGDTLLDAALDLGVSLDALADAMAAVALSGGAALQPDPSWTTRRATLAPGRLGFRFMRERPTDESTGASAAERDLLRLRAHFNLLGYAVEANDSFGASGAGLPVSPTNAPDADDDEAPLWVYRRQVRIHRLAKAAPAGERPEDDPYAGVGGTARLAFQLHDIYGNHYYGPAEAPTLELRVRYSDTLLGPGEWPGVSASYQVGGKTDAPALTVSLDFDPWSVTAVPGGDVASRTSRIDAIKAQYQSIHRQLRQSDVRVALATTLDQTLDHELDRAKLVAFLASVVQFVDSVKGSAGTLEVQEGAGLDTIAQAAGVSVVALMGANAHHAALLEQGKTLVYDGVALTTASGETIAALLARFRADEALRDKPVTPEQLAAQNRSFAGALKSGAKLLAPPKPWAEAVTLGTGAHRFPGAIFPVGVTLTIARDAAMVEPHCFLPPRPLPAGVGLDEAARAFGVSLPALLAANVDRAGLLRAGAELRAPAGGDKRTKVLDGDTLAAVAGRLDDATPLALVAANAGLRDALAAGALVRVPPPEQLIAAPLAPPQRPAATGEAGEDTHTLRLREFAQAFETVFPALKLATGGSGEAAGEALVAVQIGANGAITYTPQLAEVSSFAPPPLLNGPWGAQDVPVQPYLSGEGLLEQPVSQSFTGVDLDTWGRAFLADVDRFFSADYALMGHALSPEAYTTLVAAKERLAGAIAAKLDHILDVSGATAAQSQAAEELKQRLRMRLSDAYTTAAVVHIPVKVASPYSDPSTAPRLSGQPVDPGQETRGGAADFSLSSAKVRLYADEARPSALVFLVQSLGNRSALDLALRYKINELEHAIQTPPWAARSSVEGQIEDGYQASEWLSLIEPIDQEIGALHVPLPLRAYPVPPRVAGHRVRQRLPERPALEDIRGFSYIFEHTLSLVAQDTTYLSVVRNLSTLLGAAGEEVPLPYRLAQYMSVAPALGEDLALLADLRPDSLDATDPKQRRATAAVKAFALLVANVAEAWDRWRPDYVRVGDLAVSVEGAQVDMYKVVRNTEAEQALVTDGARPAGRSTGKRRGAQARTGATPTAGTSMAALVYDVTPVGAADGPAPALELPGYRSQVVPLDGGGRRSILTLDTGPAAAGDAAQRLLAAAVIDGLTVPGTQNIQGGVLVRRNERLLEGKVTNPAFVYQTPHVQFPAPLVPLLSYNPSFDVGAVRPFWKDATGDADLRARLGSLFGGLLSTPGRYTRQDVPAETYRVRVSAAFAFLLAGDDAAAGASAEERGILTQVPALFRPTFELSLRDDLAGGFATALAAALEAWLDAHRPARRAARWIFDVAVFAGSDMSTGQSPLLELTNLRLAIDDTP